MSEMADQLEVRLAKARRQVEKLTPSLLARAWTHSPPARSGCALSLREMDSFAPALSALRAFVPHGGTNSFHRLPGASSLFTRSQRVQIAGQLVPQDPTDEPASLLLERIQTEKRIA